jgi:hypothetical protein
MAVPQTPLDKNMAASMFKDEAFNGRNPNHSPLIGDIFDEHYWQKDHVDSFAEKHVKLAKQVSEEQLWTGRKLLEGVQGKHTIFLFSTTSRRVTPDPSSLDYHLVVLVQRKVRPPFRSYLPCPHEVRT